MGTNIYCNGIPIMRDPRDFAYTILNNLDTLVNFNDGEEDLGWPLRRLTRGHIDKIKPQLNRIDLQENLDKITWGINVAPVVDISRAEVVGTLTDWCLTIADSFSRIVEIEVFYAVKLLVDFADNHPNVNEFYFYYEQSTFGPEKSWEDPRTMTYVNYG